MKQPLELAHRSAALLACALILPAQAAATLETINGIVGRAGGRCASFVRATEPSFFSFAPAEVSVCGIAAAGYGSLGAASHSEISAPGSFGSSGALSDSMAAATFADSLTVASPRGVLGSNGTVRYRFAVDGRLSAPGAVAPATPGDTRVVLDLPHRGGKVSEVMNASVRRSDVGEISNRTLPAGWTTSTASLSGVSTFFSLPESIVWGEAWDVKVGLLAWSYGTADSFFPTTARITGLEFFNATGVAIADFSLSCASGSDYVHTVPEPSVAALVLAGLGLLVLKILRGRRRSV